MEKIPLFRHSNPYFERKRYFSLNGEWDFIIDKQAGFPSSYNEKILVPYSVETELSGINKRVSKDDFLHYKKSFVVPKEYENYRLIIHFENVDQVSHIYFNKKYLGTNFGGYLPFEFDLGKCQGENVVEVICSDDTDSPIYPRGKQCNKNKGIWYTPTSGIYGSVYIEAVPDKYIKSLKINQDFDLKKATFKIDYPDNNEEISIEISKDNNLLTKANFSKEGEACIDFSSFFYPWSPEEPSLYSVKIFGNDDEVFSSFGFRKFSSIQYKGHSVFALNNKPYFLSGVLDQGYFPKGGLTPSSFEYYENDIKAMKSYGFNCLRKHIKVEMNMFYYLCDKLGMIVMQDFVNGGAKYKDFLIYTAPFISYKFNDTKTHSLLGRKLKESRDFFENSITHFLTHFQNQTCIAIFTLFNEGWGQFDAVRLSNECKPNLNGRLLDSTSGWYDQGCGDFYSRHIYFKKIKIKPKDNRIISLTEFGGYSFEASKVNEKHFGYGKCKTKEELNQKIKDVYLNEVIHCKENNGLSIAIYTQLSDVEGEINGLLSFDRSISKADKGLLNELNGKLRFNND